MKTLDKKITIMVSLQKLTGGNSMLLRIQEELHSNGWLDYKQLERERRFLVYLFRTYRSMCPFLKGSYQTLAYWCDSKDENGYLISNRKSLIAMTNNEEEELVGEKRKESPIMKPSSRLKDGLNTLKFLLDDQPPNIFSMRFRSLGFVHYWIWCSSYIRDNYLCEAGPSFSLWTMVNRGKLEVDKS